MRSAPAGKTLWTTITSHIQPHLCALSALADLLLFNILHMHGAASPAADQQGRHPLAPGALAVAGPGVQPAAAGVPRAGGAAGAHDAGMPEPLPEPLYKGKVMHLLRWVPGLWSLLPVQLVAACRALPPAWCLL
jgi:hypothetical protein